MVSVSTQLMGTQEVRLSRSEAVFVRHGTTMDCVTRVRSGAPNQSSTAVTVETQAGLYLQREPTGPWQQLSSPHGDSEARLTSVLEVLSAGAQWILVGDDEIWGERCTGYEVTVTSDDEGTREQAILWIAQDSQRPVEMLAVTDSTPPSVATDPVGAAALRQVLTEVATWSDWNNATLVIPAIDCCLAP